MRHAAGIAEKVTLIVSPMHCAPKHHYAIRGATRGVVPSCRLLARHLLPRSHARASDRPDGAPIERVQCGHEEEDLDCHHLGCCEDLAERAPSRLGPLLVDERLVLLVSAAQKGVEDQEEEVAPAEADA